MMNQNIFADILEKLERGETPSMMIQSDEGAYLRSFVPGDRLILLGGGHVALDVYRLALLLDFEITVVDDRPEFCNHQRFPKADVLCDGFESAISRLRITGRDYVCVLTRGHRWDMQCVKAILSGVMPFYLGMIGSHHRADGLRQLLADEGYDPLKIDRLHAPIGLEIGAMTTMEIALSVCAQMIAEKRRVRPVTDDRELQQTDVNEQLLRYLASSDEPKAALIVLSSTGSTPVKSGSMMAVNALGKGCGTIGGGCGEAAAVVKARQVIGTGKSEIITIEMTEDVAAENGMVCGGVMKILVEDVETPRQNA